MKSVKKPSKAKRAKKSAQATPQATPTFHCEACGRESSNPKVCGFCQTPILSPYAKTINVINVLIAEVRAGGCADWRLKSIINEAHGALEMIEKPEPKKGLPADPEEKNDDRAGWANSAIEEFESVTRTDREDALSDLLADLGHWCDRNGFDFAKELRRGMYHYNEETEGEGRQLNFLIEKAPVEKEPAIVIHLDGGLVREVYSDSALHYVVADTDDVPKDEALAIPGTLATIIDEQVMSDHCQVFEAIINPQAVKDTVEAVEKASAQP